MSEVTADPWLGRTIEGRYRIDRQLGAGGLGCVYRATQLAIDRPVAIKVLLPDLLPSPALRQRFEREVKTLSRLSHPHIVTLTDSGVLEDGAGYLVMELLEGESLEQRLRSTGPLPPDHAIAIVRQVLIALAEAHSKHVLHRDIKPGNVFLQPLADGGVHVKLLDFGLAKVRNDLATDPGAFPTLTADGTIVGTPTYMAPEQAAGATVDASSDVYSMGVVLFEMLTGRPPFDGSTKLEIIRAHLSAPVPDLADVRPGLAPSPELRALIHKALAKDRVERYVTAREMLSALDALPTPAATYSGKYEPPRPGGPISGLEPTLSLRSSELATVDSMPSAKSPAKPPSLPAKKGDASRPRQMILGALILATLLVGAVATYVLWPASDDPAPRTSEPAPPPPEPEVPPPLDPEELVVEEPASDPANPFNAGPIPPELRDARRRILRGRRLTDEQRRDVVRYQRAHDDDPRPLLLLARDHRIGSDWNLMVRNYRAAHRMDPSVTGFTPMLPDLVRAATEGAGGAPSAIAQIYGRDALPEVERALARRRIADVERRRLELLRNRLNALPTEG